MFMNCKVCNSALGNDQTTCPVCGTPVAVIDIVGVEDVQLKTDNQEDLLSNSSEPADIFNFEEQTVESPKNEAVPANITEVKDMFSDSQGDKEQIIASPLPTQADVIIPVSQTPNVLEAPIVLPIEEKAETITQPEAFAFNAESEAGIITPSSDQLNNDKVGLPVTDDAKLIPDKTSVFETTEMQSLEKSIMPENNISNQNNENNASGTVAVNSITNNSVLENKTNENSKNGAKKKPNRLFLYIIMIILMAGAGIGGYYAFLEFGPRQVAQVNKYEYKIDRRYDASINNNFLIVDNKAKTWSIEITSIIDFKSLEEFTSKTTAVYQEVTATNKTIDKLKIVVIEVRDSGKVFYAVAAERQTGEFISAQISFKDNKLDDEAVEVFASIVKSAEKISQKVTTE